MVAGGRSKYLEKMLIQQKSVFLAVTPSSPTLSCVLHSDHCQTSLTCLPPSFFIPLPVVAHAVVLRHGKFFFLSKCKYFVWNKQKVWYYSLTTTQQQKINDCFCVFTSTAPWYPKLPQIGNNEINQKRWSCRAFFGIFCSFYSWCKWQRPAPCPLSLCCINYLQLVQDSTAQNWIPILLNFEIKILTAQSWILGSAFRSLWASFMILKYLLLETPSILPYKLLHIVDVDI